MKKENLKVIISGGSIAGCTLAALLSRQNIQVSVYEKSLELTDRGAGIVLPLPLVEQLMELNLFDRNIPYCPIDHRSFWVTNTTGEQQMIWTQSGQLMAFNWSTLYRQLRSRVPECCYYAGNEVTQLTQYHDHVSITSNRGIESCDVFIAADGVNSPSRRQCVTKTRPGTT
jgi:2-polyprenyl-6-methoxyphenol hydroxylase-like FAD-dependent oxidoreductase